MRWNCSAPAASLHLLLPLPTAALLLPHCCHSLVVSTSVPGEKNKTFCLALLLKANSFGEQPTCQILICFYWISAKRDLQKLMPKLNSTFPPPTARAKVPTELRANENFLSKVLWRLNKVPYQVSDLMDK